MRLHIYSVNIGSGYSSGKLYSNELDRFYQEVPGAEIIKIEQELSNTNETMYTNGSGSAGGYSTQSGNNSTSYQYRYLIFYHDPSKP